MELQPGKRYERGEGESAQQFFGRLAGFLEGRLSGIPLRIVLTNGATYIGRSGDVGSDRITLERVNRWGRTETAMLMADGILAFSLLDEDNPAERAATEVRGGAYG